MASSSQKRDPLESTYYVVLGILALIFATIFLKADIARLLIATSDGAGYYLQIARNAAEGRGLTFDGMHATNGFHPLWMAMLIVFFKIVHASSELSFRLVGVIVVGLVAIASVQFHRALRCLTSPTAAFCGSLFYVATAFLNINLMESAIVLLTISGMFLYGWRYQVYGQYRPATAFVFGLLLGLAILARLDVAFLAIVIGVVGLIQIIRQPEQRREQALRLLLTVVGSSLLVLPYLLYNQYAFGSVIPVSGRLESMLPHTNIHDLPNAIRELGNQRLILLVAAALYLVWYGRNQKRGARIDAHAESYHHGAVAVLAFACLLQGTNEVLFVRWRLYWHFVLLIPLTGAVASIVCQKLLVRTSGLWARGTSFALCAIAVVLCVKSVTRCARADGRNAWYRYCYDTALWIRDNTSPNAKLAMLWPEVTGYYGGRQTVDLAGLTNNIEFQEAIQRQALREYLARSGVSYLVVPGLFGLDVASGNEQEVTLGRYESAMLRFRSDLFGIASDPIQVRRQDEVYRSEVFQVFGGKPRCVIVWRMNLADGET